MLPVVSGQLPDPCPLFPLIHPEMNLPVDHDGAHPCLRSKACVLF